MKTTIDITDHLLQRSKRQASKENKTLRDFVEDALQQALVRKETEPQAPVEPVTFGGDGLSDEFAGRGWDAVREAIYNGRGS